MKHSLDFFFGLLKEIYPYGSFRVVDEDHSSNYTDEYSFCGIFENTPSIVVSRLAEIESMYNAHLFIYPYSRPDELEVALYFYFVVDK